jgi:hypothetical protein
MSQSPRNPIGTLSRIILAEYHGGWTKYALEQAPRRCTIVVVPTAHFPSPNMIAAATVFTLIRITYLPNSRSKTLLTNNINKLRCGSLYFEVLRRNESSFCGDVETVYTVTTAAGIYP